MGFYTRFTNPEARKIITQYYNFIRKHNAIYRHNTSHAEAVLLFPRKAVHAGDVDAVAKFRETGMALLESHVLFDILPDDILGRLASQLYQQYEDYKNSRKDWEDAYVTGLDLLGFKYTSRSQPFQGASGATHPVLAEAVTQFQGFQALHILVILNT